jgi:hypothetical protein
MDDEPTASMHVLISDPLGLTIKFKLEVARREDMKSGGCSILDHEGGLLGFGDNTAESGECFSNGFFVR